MVAELDAYDMTDRLLDGAAVHLTQPFVLFQRTQRTHRPYLNYMICLLDLVKPETGYIYYRLYSCIPEPHPHHAAHDTAVPRLIQLVRLFQRSCFNILIYRKQNMAPFSSPSQDVIRSIMSPCLLRKKGANESSHSHLAMIHFTIYARFMQWENHLPSRAFV